MWTAGTAAPDPFLLAAYHQEGQYLYLAGGWTGGGPTGLTTTRRLDMTSAPGVWSNGPTFTMGRSDFGLAYDPGTGKLYAMGGDAQGGGFFDSTNEVDEVDISAWPAGTWNLSPPNLPAPNRSANQAGFFGNGSIWSTGGIDGSTFTFLADHLYRPNVCGPTVTAAVSRKTHGASGPFDVNLPLMPPPNNGVECRTDNPTGASDYTIVVSFSTNVSVTGSPQAQVTMGTGCVGSGGVCDPNGTVMVSGDDVTVPLTNIANAQNINVRINGVNSVAAGGSGTDFDIPMGVLVGDTNGNRAVNASDVSQTKARSGQTVDGTNFRSDVNHNGSINAADINIVKAKSGTSIP